MRLFVAIELSDDVRREVVEVVDGLSRFNRCVKWTKPEQIHMTVKFLGEMMDDLVTEVSAAAELVAADCSPCQWTVDRAGCFPTRGRVRVIWGGGEETPGELAGCVRNCEEAFESLGFPRERRPFTAHATLGRVRNDTTGDALRSAVESAAPCPVTQRIDGLTVFQSVLQPQGASYHVIGRYPFGGAD